MANIIDQFEKDAAQAISEFPLSEAHREYWMTLERSYGRAQYMFSETPEAVDPLTLNRWNTRVNFFYGNKDDKGKLSGYGLKLFVLHRKVVELEHGYFQEGELKVGNKISEYRQPGKTCEIYEKSPVCKWQHGSFIFSEESGHFTYWNYEGSEVTHNYTDDEKSLEIDYLIDEDAQYRDYEASEDDEQFSVKITYEKKCYEDETSKLDELHLQTYNY